MNKFERRIVAKQLMAIASPLSVGDTGEVVADDEAVYTGGLLLSVGSIVLAGGDAIPAAILALQPILDTLIASLVESGHTTQEHIDRHLNPEDVIAIRNKVLAFEPPSNDPSS